MKLSVSKYFNAFSHVQDVMSKTLDDFKTPKKALIEILQSEMVVCANEMEKNELLGHGELQKAYSENQRYIKEKQI